MAQSSQWGDTSERVERQGGSYPSALVPQPEVVQVQLLTCALTSVTGNRGKKAATPETGESGELSPSSPQSRSGEVGTTRNRTVHRLYPVIPGPALFLSSVPGSCAHGSSNELDLSRVLAHGVHRASDPATRSGPTREPKPAYPPFPLSRALSRALGTLAQLDMDIPKKDLCILALAQDIVLFPSLVVSIHLASPHATALLDHVIKNCGNSTTDAAGTVLACIPRKAVNSVQNALADAANRADATAQDRLAQVIRLPPPAASHASHAADDLATGTIDIDDLFECESIGPEPS